MSELRLKSTGTIKLFENDNTSNITIASPASLGADRTITLPDGDVTLVAGTMSTGGVTLSGSTNNTVATVTGADALAGEANLTFDGTDLTLGTGNLVIGTSGKGIDFSATADSGGTMTSELLDDYEEGTWTPGQVNVSNTSQEGRYTKIGRCVYYSGYWVMETTADTNNLVVTGLPFTSGDNESSRGGAYVNYTTGGTALVNDNGCFGLGGKNDTNLYYYGASGNGTQENDLWSGKQMYFCGFYFTS